MGIFQNTLLAAAASTTGEDIVGGELWTWGQNNKGQLGLGIERDRYFPMNKHSLEECKKL